VVKAALAEIERANRRLGIAQERQDQIVKLNRFLAHEYSEIHASLDRIKQLLIAIDTDGVAANGHGAAASE
jgi:hypothetical protein